MTEDNRTVTIDGTTFKLADLSENARNQLLNLQVTDAEVKRLNQQLAIYQTARAAYANALSAELPKEAEKAKPKPRATKAAPAKPKAPKAPKTTH
jgi:hypothetical protein